MLMGSAIEGEKYHEWVNGGGVGGEGECGDNDSCSGEAGARESTSSGSVEQSAELALQG